MTTREGGGEAEILADIERVAREHLAGPHPLPPLRPETRLVEDLRLDSLRLLTLVIEVENRFRIRLDEGDEAAIETVGDLVRVIEAKRAG